MLTDTHRYEINSIIQRVIGCSYKVGNTLGCGFLEKVYANALVHELRKAGMHVAQQHPIKVRYDGVIVGEFVADLLIEQCVLVELKAVRMLDDIHKAQCFNYLKAAGIHICLLIIFGNPKVEIKRILQGRV